MVSHNAQGDQELQQTKSALLDAVRGTDRGIFGIPVSVRWTWLAVDGETRQSPPALSTACALCKQCLVKSNIQMLTVFCHVWCRRKIEIASSASPQIWRGATRCRMRRSIWTRWPEAGVCCSRPSRFWCVRAACARQLAHAAPPCLLTSCNYRRLRLLTHHVDPLL